MLIRSHLHLLTSALVGVAAGVLPSSPGFAASPLPHLADVRIGVHPGFTRVVLETDRAVHHRLYWESEHLVVQLGAEASEQRLSGPGDRVDSVRVAPSAGESWVWIRVPVDRVSLSQQTLGSPPRIVLDFSERAPEASSAYVAAEPTVTDVRVGLHGPVTRLVVETDLRIDYRIDRPRPGVLRVHLPKAAAKRRRILPSAGLVESVRVGPSSAGSEALARLASDDVIVRQQVLDDPPRIVIDLERGSLAAVADAETNEAPDRSSESGSENRSRQPPDSLARETNPPRIYKWVDASGIAHYTTDPDRIPADLRSVVLEGPRRP